MRDAVVIGAGLAGLAAAIRLAEAGATVTLVSKGVGGIQLGQGTIDVLGYTPECVDAPLEALASHVATHPHHPYAHFTGEQVGEALTWFASVVGPDLLVGDPSRNVLLPTAVGALRPTALYQPSMEAGIPSSRPVLVVGLRRLKDFPAQLIAANLARQRGPGGAIAARALWVDLEIRPGEADTSGVQHARAFDLPEYRERLASAILPFLDEGEIVALPAVIGLEDLQAWHHLRHLLGRDLAEIPLQPPSVPGMRINAALTAKAKALGVRLMNGVSVIGHASAGGRLTSVTVNSAGRPRHLEARAFVLAAGGFESGALELDSHMRIRDTVLDLPVASPPGQPFHGDFWGADQPIFLSGFEVDDQMRVLGPAGLVHTNVHAAGGNLRGATRWREKSGDGIALASAVRAADAIIGSLS